MLKSKVLLKGDKDRVTFLLNSFIMNDLPFIVFIENKKIYETAILENEMSQKLTLKLEEKDTDLSDVDEVVYLPNTGFYNSKISDAARVACDMSVELDKLRDTTNDVISRGFKGKVIINAPHDEVFVYFAAYFSGINVNNIIGVGTLPQKIMFLNKLIKYFNLNEEDINVNTFGLNTNNLVAWSRIYIGPASLLSYIADKNYNYDSELITNIQETISNSAIVSNQVIQAKAIIKLLKCLDEKLSLICSIVSVNKENDKFKLNLEPKSINQNGIIQSINLQLSDADQKQLDDCVKWSKDIIANIKEAKNHE